MPYRFEFDKVHRILRACIQGIIGDEEVTKFRADIAKLISDIQPTACVVDLSDTKQYDISSEMIRSMAKAAPALPNVSIAVILVAPAPHIFGASRMFQIISEEKRPWVRVVKSSLEAYKLLDVDLPSFEPLPSDFGQ